MAGMYDLASLVSRLEVVASRLEAGGVIASKGGGEPETAFVAAFDTFLADDFSLFLEKSRKIGGEVAEISNLVEKAFKAERDLLSIAAKSKKPGDKELQMLLKPISDTMADIATMREKGRRCDFFNHLSAISESIPALGWVTVAPAPAPFVKEMSEAAQFYTNRVLKDWKEKSKDHIEWVKIWIQTLDHLQSYVKQYHTTGLVWNAKGGDASAAGSAGGPPPPPGPPLPPPPPPPVDLSTLGAPQPDPAAQARGNLMASLQKGSDITKGLKKVSDEEKTHKNPNLRASGAVPHKEKSPAPARTYGGGSTAAAAKPPKLELDGKKWVVEYFKSNPNLAIEETETSQSVYVYKCEGVTLKVSGKCNNIILDSCKKSAVVFDSVVSSCEFINCQSIQMQVLGSVPTISVDKTDGCQMYLSKDSVNAEIVTAKSSEMNVMIPVDDDFVEQPIPEQFKTVVKNGKLSTAATESV